jgi:TolB protein
MKSWLLGILLLCGMLAWPARAEKINLEVYASNLDSISIGVVPFKCSTDRRLSEDEPWKIIANDLEFSGRFVVSRLEKTDSAEFNRKNIPLYIDGECTVSGQTVDLSCSLRDAKTSDVLAGTKTKGELKLLRAMTHRFCNQLVEMLFNEKGIFESRILYVKDDGAKKNIMIMDWDGKNQHQLTQTNTVNIFPAFVDSTSYIWTSFIRGHPDIYKGVIGGSSRAVMQTRFIQTSPSYSPIVGKIAFASSRDGNMEIYTCDIDGTGLKRLTHGKSIETAPCWSPNGFQIVFTSDRSGQPQLYVMDADGANVKRITHEGNYQDSPSWSPKGDRIAYQSLTNGKFEIWTVRPDGTNAVQVTSCPGSNEYPSWAADGAHIVFSSGRGKGCDLYAVKADGTHLTRLTFSNNAKMPDWSNW